MTPPTSTPDAPADLDTARLRRSAGLTQDEEEARAAKAEGNGYPPGETTADATPEPRGQSIEDIEANGSTEEDDGQYALVVGREGGKEVTLATLIKRGTPVTVEFKMEGKAVKGIGGLIPFGSPDVMLLVPARAGKVEVDPTYGLADSGEEEITKVVLRPHIRPRTVLNAKTPEARAALLGYGDPIAQIVAAGRQDGTKDADIRAALMTEIDAALAQRA